MSKDKWPQDYRAIFPLPEVLAKNSVVVPTGVSSGHNPCPLTGASHRLAYN